MNIGLVQGSNYSALIRKTAGEKKIANIEELSEIEKLENFKKEIWKEIDSMPWGCDISIHITDDAFKRMMNQFRIRSVTNTAANHFYQSLLRCILRFGYLFYF